MKTLPITEHIVHVNDIKMHYKVRGNGEPLLLIHGFTGSSADWENVDLKWAADFQLIMPDMRAHGRSSSNASKYTFQQVALDMFALMDKLNIFKIKAIGCSGGGNTLLHMATQQPERISAMILVSATTHYPEQARAFMTKVTVDSLTEEMWKMLRQKHYHGDAQILNFYEVAKNFAADNSDMNFTSSQLSTISARTLIVQGDKDFLYPLDISINMHKAISNSNLAVIPNAGHVPIFGDNNEYFNKIAKAFLMQSL